MNKEATELFLLVARFEYALKTCGFLQKAKPDEKHPTRANDERPAMASWCRFAKETEVKDLLENPTGELEEAIKYITANPPKKQIEKNEKLGWKDAKQPETAEGILGRVRQVRNNLFHGAKFMPEWSEMCPDRDRALISHSITILKECIKKDDRIKKIVSFNEIAQITDRL